MLDSVIRHFLEELSVELRKAMFLEDNRILIPSDFEELFQKIQSDEHFEIYEHFEIENIGSDYKEIAYMSLDEEIFTFHLSGVSERKFYNLIEMFTYSFILNRKKLTPYELKHSDFEFPRWLYNDNIAKENEYLMRAFMMPEKAMQSLVMKYGDGVSYNVERVLNATKNEFASARLIDLGLDGVCSFN